MCRAGLTGSELMLPEDSYEVSGGVEHPGKMGSTQRGFVLGSGKAALWWCRKACWLFTGSEGDGVRCLSLGLVWEPMCLA